MELVRHNDRHFLNNGAVMAKSKILMVDDHIDNIHLATTVLDYYDISYALSGKEALQMIQEFQYDLILLDVFMTGLDGFETCIEIRKHNDYNNIPIIFVTSDHDIESITRGFDVGGQDYIHKPYNAKELQARVRSNLLLRNYAQSLEREVIIEKEKNRARDTILFQEFKMSQMGEAFSMIVHQWKQPLGSISTLAGALRFYPKRKNLEPEYVSEKAEKIEVSIKHLSETMDTFKDFFKLKNEFEKVSIRTLIDNSLLLIKHVIKKSDTTINVNISEEDLDTTILTLPNELIQVFLVILQNAMDIFLEKNMSGTINLSLMMTAEDVDIIIEDNAGGTNPENLKKFFDLHFTTKGDKGSGLGLYMVKQIIQEHLHGNIQATNTKEGIQFNIRVPSKSSCELSNEKVT